MRRESDMTYPLGPLDNLKLFRMLVMHVALVFDAPLDPAKLRTSLTAVINEDGWKKLGARIRRKRPWGLEYHIPSQFTEERPPFSYSHTVYPVKRLDHPMGSCLPAASSGISVAKESDRYMSLIKHANTPSRLKDYVNQDRPLLGLHVISFDDATIVTMTWPHVLFDIMALTDLFQAWILNLQRREKEMKTALCPTFHPLVELGNRPSETYHLAHHQLSVLSLARFGIRNMFQFAFPRIERHTICIPAEVFKTIRERAVREALELRSPDSKVFLTDNDILCAWWTQMCYSDVSEYRDEVSIINVQSLKSSLSGNLLPDNSCYLSNTLGLITTLLPSKDVAGSRIGDIALKVRESVQKSASRDQIEAFENLRKQSWHKEFPLFGSPSTYPVVFSNWSKANLFSLDFSAATVSSQDEHSAKPVSPILVLPVYTGWRVVDLVCIMGQDRDGNYWLDFSTERKRWKGINKKIRNAQQ